MPTVQVTSVGNSVGIVLPEELLARLRVEEGDVLFVTETPNGVELSTHDDSLDRQMKTAESVMDKRRDVLKKLAE